MTAMTPLQQALESWLRKEPDRQQQVDDALALAETGVFSTMHIILITGLPHVFARELLKGNNPQKQGGRFNPDALPTLLDIATQYASGRTCDHGMLRTVVNIGVSPRMISKLTGVPKSNIYQWIGEAK